MPKPKLEHVIDQRLVEQKDRTYLGYSGLGNPCMRALWYSFRWATKRYVERRIERLFRRGDYEEEVIIADLEYHGMKVTNTQAEIEGFAKHVLGHIDGEVENVPKSVEVPDFVVGKGLLEMKTAKQELYKKYVKDGVRKANFVYYCQTQSYMGKRGLKWTMFVITNKNTEERNIEYIKFDEHQFRSLEDIAESVVSTDVPAPRIGDSTWFECKFCDYKKICHHGEKIQKTCRTCKYAAIVDDGKWECLQAGGFIPEHIQREGCDLYELLETLK